jgi:hypothetical protein
MFCSPQQFLNTKPIQFQRQVNQAGVTVPLPDRLFSVLPRTDLFFKLWTIREHHLLKGTLEDTKLTRRQCWRWPLFPTVLPPPRPSLCTEMTWKHAELLQPQPRECLQSERPYSRSSVLWKAGWPQALYRVTVSNFNLEAHSIFQYSRS